jgi:hypothetical protein
MHVNWPNTYTYNNNKKTSLEKIIKKKSKIDPMANSVLLHRDNCCYPFLGSSQKMKKISKKYISKKYIQKKINK